MSKDKPLVTGAGKLFDELKPKWYAEPKWKLAGELVEAAKAGTLITKAGDMGLFADMGIPVLNPEDADPTIPIPVQDVKLWAMGNLMSKSEFLDEVLKDALQKEFAYWGTAQDTKLAKLQGALANVQAEATNLLTTLGTCSPLEAYTLLAGKFGNPADFAKAWDLYCHQFWKHKLPSDQLGQLLALPKTGKSPPSLSPLLYGMDWGQGATDAFNAAEQLAVSTVPSQGLKPPGPEPKPYHSSAKTGGKDDWGTPWDFYLWLDQRCGFTLDVCATAENAKCGDYLTPEMNALNVDWWGRVFMNPPYSQVGPWTKKLVQHAINGQIEFGAALVAARPDTQWWWDAVMMAHEVWFLKGRLQFTTQGIHKVAGVQGGPGVNSAPFPSAVLVYRPKLYGTPWVRETRWVDWKHDEWLDCEA